MNKIPKTVKTKTYLASLILVSMIFLASVVYVASNGSFTAPNLYLDDVPSSASYVVKTDGTYFWAVRYDGKLLWSGTDDDNVIQGAINNSTAIGGTVFVRAGTYSASVVLKNKVRLVIEKGATGITVSVYAGATCWLEDYNGAVKYFYSSGSLVWKENLSTGEFWWGSSNRTDTLAYPVASYSYEVFVDGSTYKMKNGSTGQIDFSSTDASAVINNALGNLTSGGKTLIKKGNYQDVSILINGSITEYYFWTLEGEGINETILTGVGSSNVITFQNEAGVVIKDLAIALPMTGTSGDGIRGQTQPNVASCRAFSRIENVKVIGGSGTGWCINIQDPNTMYLHNIYCVPYGAGGICLNQSADHMNLGNTLIDGNNLIDIHANGGIGLLLTTTAGLSHNLNIISTSGMFEVACTDSGYTGTIGIYAQKVSYCDLKGLIFEYVNTAIKTDVCAFCSFEGSDLYSFVATDGDAFLNMTTSTCCCTFRHFLVANSAGTTIAFTGGTTDPRYFNLIEGWAFKVYGGHITNSVGAGTLVRDCLKYPDFGGDFVGFSGSPVGVITQPTHWGTQLVDWGGDGTIANNTLYTVFGVSKTIYIYGGTWSGANNCTLSGTVIFTTTPIPVHVVMGDTIIFQWSSAPTIVVVGD